MENIYPRGVETVAGAVIINKDNQVLLFKSPKWNNKFMTAGGHIEPGEKIMAAAVREAKEEGGVNVEALGILYVGEYFVVPPQFKRNAHFIWFHVLCKWEDGQDIKPDMDEMTDFKWLSLNEALRLADDTCTPALNILKKRMDSGEKFFNE